MRLILFDFDGTITTKDTLMEFTRSSVGEFRFLAGLTAISPVLLLQKIGLLSAQKAKEIFLAYFFKGLTLEDFGAYARAFTSSRLPALIRPGARDAITAFTRQGDRIIIVSASPDSWIKPWAEPLGLEVLSTQLASENGRLTGKIAGKNCNGVEKVNRITGHLKLSDYSAVIVYGDTSGDLPMLELATERHFKPFRE